MPQKLSGYPQKVLAPDRNNTMKMLKESMESVKFDNNKAFKKFMD